MARSKQELLQQGLSSRPKTVASIPDLTKGLAIETTAIKELDLNNIHRDENQPRKYFNDASLEDLANSIKDQGLLQPIGVRRDPKREGHYFIVMGERRYRASKMAGNTAIKAFVMEDVDEQKAYILALLENLQRDDLTPEEEAKAIQQLMDRGLTQKQVAETIHKSEGYISKRIQVFKDPALAQLVRDGVPISQVEEIVRIKHPEGRKRLVKSVQEGADILQTREMVNTYNKSLDLDDLELRTPRNQREGKSDKQAVRDAISALNRVKKNLEDADQIPDSAAQEIADLCYAILSIVE